ncbi:MAG: ATP-binding protein, partial [Actinomycetes bacterium]
PLELALTLHLPRDLRSVPVARRLCAQSMRTLGVVDDDVAAVELALTEATANVVEHAANDEAYDVRVRLVDGSCVIDVIDSGAGFDGKSREGTPGTPDERESGRGVALMRALVDRLQFQNEPSDGFLVHMVKHLTFDPDHPVTRAWGSDDLQELTDALNVSAEGDR